MRCLIKALRNTLLFRWRDGDVQEIVEGGINQTTDNGRTLSAGVLNVIHASSMQNVTPTYVHESSSH